MSLLLALLLSAPNYTLPVLVEDGSTIASAALLAPSIALTAEHAVKGLYAKVIVQCGEEQIVGFSVKTSVVADLALVMLSRPCYAVATVEVATGDPEEGDFVLIQGYPAGGPRKSTGAVVSGYERVPYQDGYRRHVMMLDGRVTGGNSGGPVLAKNGTLVGIVSAGICYSVSACYGAAIPASDIRIFLGLE